MSRETKEKALEQQVQEVKKITSRYATRNQVKHFFNDGSTTKTYHTDVAQNIYRLDGTVIALYNGKEVTATDRLALCVEVCALVLCKEKKMSKETALLKAKKSAKENNSVPKLSDFGLTDVRRHSVKFLNDLGVRALNGNLVQNK